MRLLKLFPHLLIALLLAVPPSFALNFPLSDTSARAAYFLGQRHDASMGEFLARYSKHLPAPKLGPYISDVLFFTPFAQMVLYSSRQSIYSAQQAEVDGRTKFSTVDVSVYIYFTQTYGPYVPSSSSGNDMRMRGSNFWRDLKFHVFDGDVLREPASIYGEPLYLCSNNGGCSLVGSQVHLSFPAEMFTSDSATVEVTGPDDTTIQTAFDLVALR
jgi:hypothetical protein